ncbi:DUF6456 domain-containing protein [Agrobacterium sp. rho-13.3]|uniref:DUF6456 domain-containing protein n=1 Tax=Agrobacterium sp. rho-13.3 TaxID=3072980 RepID=UPI002A0B9B54|nr:DUF6456 domain-containing protein [Agrobacterium sp. rho-13.3]MDX8308736.1 DUF6456 domain-containing protein [Agrobacterium sp. rho-13.3]
MTEGKNKPLQSANRALVRLLRFIGRGPALVTDHGAHLDISLEQSAERRQVEKPVLEQAISAGLLRLEENRLYPQDTVRAFLKRAMVKERDEIFQEQHRLLDVVSLEVAGERQTVRRNELSSPLLALVRLKDRDGQPFFPPDALDAGERLSSDFHRGLLSPRITASWEPRLSKRMKGQTSGAQDLSDSALSARLRFSKAADAMGPELAGVAIDVCCFEKGLELVERERQWPVRSAKLMLRAALQALARHYAPPPPPTRKRDSHHWGAKDYRPNL